LYDENHQNVSGFVYPFPLISRFSLNKFQLLKDKDYKSHFLLYNKRISILTESYGFDINVC
jgi:hypothetical protein